MEKYVCYSTTGLKIRALNLNQITVFLLFIFTKT